MNGRCWHCDSTEHDTATCAARIMAERAAAPQPKDPANPTDEELHGIFWAAWNAVPDDGTCTRTPQYTAARKAVFEAGRVSMAGEVAKLRGYLEDTGADRDAVFVRNSQLASEKNVIRESLGRCEQERDRLRYERNNAEAEIKELRSEVEIWTRRYSETYEHSCARGLELYEQLARAEKAEAELARRDTEIAELRKRWEAAMRCANEHAASANAEQARAEKAEAELAIERRSIDGARYDAETRALETEADNERLEAELASLRADSFAAAIEALDVEALRVVPLGASGGLVRGLRDSANHLRLLQRQAASQSPQPAADGLLHDRCHVETGDSRAARSVRQPTEAQWERKNRGITLTLSEEGDHVTGQYWVVRGPDFSHSGPSPAIALRWCAEFLAGRPLPASLQAVLDRNWPEDGTAPEPQPAKSLIVGVDPAVPGSERTVSVCVDRAGNAVTPPHETAPRLEKGVRYRVVEARSTLRGNSVRESCMIGKTFTDDGMSMHLGDGWYPTGTIFDYRVVRVEPEKCKRCGGRGRAWYDDNAGGNCSEDRCHACNGTGEKGGGK